MGKNYNTVFETLVNKTEEYIRNAGLKSIILGISGGIDSTVVAAICSVVGERIGIPLIGRSLPTKFNKIEEVTTAKLVGKAFCNDFEEVSIKNPYESFLSLLDRVECGTTAIANGNIQARLRMIYLYNLASIHGGLVMDTDNLTENNLGYFTIHGDVGDFKPIGGLWKTEVFELAKWLYSYYLNHVYTKPHEQARAIAASLELKPTAGLGITDSDLDEIGADSYEQVDTVLKEILSWREFVKDRYDNFEDLKKAFWKTIDNAELISPETSSNGVPWSIYKNIVNKHFSSEFKRLKQPVIKLS